MAAFDPFDDEEWKRIRRLPVTVASLISAVDYSSLSEKREYAAFASFISKAGQKRKRAPVIAAVLAETDPGDLEAFQDSCAAVATTMAGEKPVEIALAEAKAVARIVDTKLERRAAKSYKGFVMDVALVVARAHKESMLPLGSPVSVVENYHLRRLEAALGF